MPADLSNEEARARKLAKAIRECRSDGDCTLCDIAILRYRREGRATLLTSLIEKVEAERPVLTTASTVVDAAYHEAYCRFLTLLRTEAETDG